MEDYNKIIDWVKLMAQTGLFFANADGAYSRKEERYLNDFLAGLNQIGDLPDHLKQDVLDTKKKRYTLEEIVSNTRSLLDGFEPDERKAILKALKGFINKMIRIDGHLHPLEEANYKEWKTRFGM